MNSPKQRPLFPPAVGEVVPSPNYEPELDEEGGFADWRDEDWEDPGGCVEDL